MNYPDLSKEDIISIDIETSDPNLKEMGTGVYRKDGTVFGVAVAVPGHSEYYSLRHQDSGQDHEKNRKYLTEILALPDKLGANLLYDLDWLMNYEGIKVKGPFNDVQIAEPIINEYRKSYSLNALAEHYLGKRKEETEMAEWVKSQGLKGKPVEYVSVIPFEITRKYAKVDAELPLEIFEEQKKILHKERIWDIYEMERDLLGLLIEMRGHGVQLSHEGIAYGIKKLHSEIENRTKDLFDKYGEFNLNSGPQLAKVLDNMGVPYPLKPLTNKMKEKGETKGNPHLDKKVLAKLDHPIGKNVLEVRGMKTILNTFFIGSFSELLVDGRLHCNFNPLKSDEYGTITGRLSSSRPNLQNVPSQESSYVDLCRGIFIPEEGCMWGKIDWSQIEYRLITHYAEGPKSDTIRTQYNENPDTDYHQWVMDMTGLDRKHAKMLNFGTAYYMGVKTSAETFGWTLEESKEFLELYHREVPFVKITRNKVVEVAKARGFIRTILGRKARLTDEIIKNGKEHAFFNRLIQGSAADIMKKSMVVAHKAGLFNVLIPHLTVHDELDVSIPRTKEGAEAFWELKNVMETCVDISVPLRADADVGPNWYEVKPCNSIEDLRSKLGL